MVGKPGCLVALLPAKAPIARTALGPTAPGRLEGARGAPHFFLSGKLCGPRLFIPSCPLWPARGSGAGWAGRRCVAAYLGRAGPRAVGRRRVGRVARGLADPGWQSSSYRAGGGCAALARSCQASPAWTLARGSLRPRPCTMRSRLGARLRAPPGPGGPGCRAPVWALGAPAAARAS